MVGFDLADAAAAIAIDGVAVITLFVSQYREIATVRPGWLLQVGVRSVDDNHDGRGSTGATAPTRSDGNPRTARAFYNDRRLGTARCPCGDQRDQKAAQLGCRACIST